MLLLLLLILLNLRSIVAHGTHQGSIVLTEGHPIRKYAQPIYNSELTCRSLGSSSITHTTTDPKLKFPGSCGAKVDQWIDLMLQGMKETKGAAIAAPQIGVSRRIIILSIPKERIVEEIEPTSIAKKYGATKSKVTAPVVLINPELEPFDSELPDEEFVAPLKILVWETCLSVPNQKVAVWRWPEIKWRATRLDGIKIEGIAIGRGIQRSFYSFFFSFSQYQVLSLRCTY